MTLVCLVATLSSCGAKKLDRLDATAPVASDQPIPVIDFLRPRTLSHAILNPAGNRFAALATINGDQSTLLVYDLTTRKTKAAGDSDLDIYNIGWLDDHRLLFQVGLEKLYAYGIYTADADNLGGMVALDRNDVISPIGVPRKDPLKPYIWIAKDATRHGIDGGVVQIDARGLNSFDYDHRIPVLRSFQNPPGGGAPVGYATDANGDLAFAVTRKDGIDTLHRLVKNAWEPTSTNLDEITIVGPGNRPNELVVSASDAAGKPSVLRSLDLATGKLGDVLYRDDHYDPTRVSLYRRPSDGRILGLNFQRKGPQSVWLDPSYGELQRMLSTALPGEVVRIIGSDQAEKRFFVFASSDLTPGRYLLFDRERAQLSVLSETAP